MSSTFFFKRGVFKSHPFNLCSFFVIIGCYTVYNLVFFQTKENLQLGFKQRKSPTSNEMGLQLNVKRVIKRASWLLLMLHRNRDGWCFLLHTQHTEWYLLYQLQLYHGLKA